MCEKLQRYCTIKTPTLLQSADLAIFIVNQIHHKSQRKSILLAQISPGSRIHLQVVSASFRCMQRKIWQWTSDYNNVV